MSEQDSDLPSDHPQLTTSILQGTQEMPRFDRRRHASSGLWFASAVCVVVGLINERTAQGQAEVRNPTQPILVSQTGGHSAPVQSLVFMPDGGSLLSGGMDKLVHVWTLNDGAPRLSRTLRPPIWRGRRGAVYAMALSPNPTDGHHLLAIGGYGVESQYGNIGLYRYPGRNGLPTGEIVAQLPSGDATKPEPLGHTDVVRCLAFDPTGRWLASGSNDRTVRIWDVATRRSVAVLRGHTGPVTALGFAFAGRRLITTGPDGTVLLWDVSPAQLAPPVDPRPPRAPIFRVAPEPRAGAAGGELIKALAIADDGRKVVVGRQDGWLALLTGTEQALTRTAWLPLRPLAPGAARGEVLAAAFSRDGQRLAVARLRAGLSRAGDLIDPRSEVEIRTGNDLNVTGVIASSNLVNACAFSPNGQRLAFAGGDRQSISLRDVVDPRRAPSDLMGAGSSLWDVGFTADSQSVGYSWTGPGSSPPPTFWGFDLKRRATAVFNTADLRRAQATLDGWTLTPVSPFVIEARNPAQPAVSLTLNPPTDGRWWSFTWVPPLAGSHPSRVVAVGTESGNVVAFVFNEARREFSRTRVFAGPSSAAYAVASSPDGRWLLAGSADQTLRLWPLAGCDTIPPLGATIPPGADGRPTVSTVSARGTAEAMGLKVGDVVVESYIEGKPVEPTVMLDRIAQTPQGVRLDLRARRGDQIVELGTSRRENPALSLFVSTDQEWVVWMPQGYYETSIAGDRRFLGWHRNATKADGTDVDLARPTDFISVDRFENELRKPAVLDQLIDTADVGQALDLVGAAERDAPALVAANSPPVVAAEVPGLRPDRPLIVQSPELPLVARAATETRNVGRKAIRRLRVLVDARRVYESPLAQLAATVEQRVALTLPPGRHRVSLIATDDGGQERVDDFEVDYQPPPNQPAPALPTPVRTPRFLVLAIGTGVDPEGRFPKNPMIPAIGFAADDARDVGRFLNDAKVQRFKSHEIRELSRFGSSPADGDAIRAALDRVDMERMQGELGADDTVVLWLESHVVRREGRDFLVTTDSGSGMPPAGAIPTEEIVDRLAALADYGTRVVVLLDGVHASKSDLEGWASRTDGLVRALYKRNVIVATASIQGPSRRLLTRGHGAFAEAIVTSLPVGASEPWTLDTFGNAVVEQVSKLTSRGQVARFYVPGTFPGDRVSVFSPQPAASVRAPQ